MTTAGPTSRSAGTDATSSPSRPLTLRIEIAPVTRCGKRRPAATSFVSPGPWWTEATPTRADTRAQPPAIATAPLSWRAATKRVRHHEVAAAEDRAYTQ
jgi:hypothetical protein